MPSLILSLQQAASAAARSSGSPQGWNPVYRALVPVMPPVPEGTRDDDVSATETDMLLRQLCATALMVVSVTQNMSTRRLRIGLDPSGATLESSRDAAPSRWWTAPLPEVPAAIAALLQGAGIHDEARLTVDAAAPPLRPTEAQLARARDTLARGASAESAFAEPDDLDPRLRDALTARGTRLALSLMLHDPRREDRAASFSRAWVRGRHGLYRSDAGAPPGQVRLVEDGDVLGTALPLLDEGLRFAATCTGGAR